MLYLEKLIDTGHLENCLPRFMYLNRCRGRYGSGIIRKSIDYILYFIMSKLIVLILHIEDGILYYAIECSVVYLINEVSNYRSESSDRNTSVL